MIETPAALQDETAGILAGYGALGCEIRGFARGRRDGSSVRVVGYFTRLDAAALRRLSTMLSKAGMLTPGSRPAVMRVEDPGWATMWQKRFEPFPVGARLLVVPPWNRAGADERIAIVIRPGQAFGTGHHASTFGTLSLVEQVFDGGRCERALDVGTGSGILAIAMSKLGAKQVVAIDFDPIALDNARENAKLNDVETNLRLSVAPLSSIRGRFDIITANILSSVLIEMAPQLKARLRPGGHLILAGILAREADAVMKVYNTDLRRLRTRADGAWCALDYQG
ncbi:MAG TPA: 50S ribosomal protein L11 methyltransferase [Candidatus Binataceae bacterium]|nr:50S ribosomal protein L11 methyltransferase [Candidatus Binataceae bacterium]